MKKHLFVYVFLFSLFPLISFAQSAMEDVIYLKNGTVYRGIIVAEMPNLSYKIELRDGSALILQAQDVEKITKETKQAPNTPGASTQTPSRTNSSIDNSDREQVYKNKGYFFEFQFHLAGVGGGLRMINGYKINQYATLGLGLGFGGIYLPVNGHTINNDVAPYAGFYFPLFLYYSGDILKKDVTPFYVLEAGYAMAYDPLPGGADGATYVRYNIINGGPMGSVGFGMRVYLKPRFVFTISANLDIQYARTDVYDFEYGSYGPGPPTPTNVYSHMAMLMPGFKIGIGMVK
jgi:hypothetical protein